MGEVLDKVAEFKKELDKISPTFCVAKWKQVTMHLESGLTHSCHHPRAHTVPLEELEHNVSALHNTDFKKKMRASMLRGEIVPECDYCNTIEERSEERAKEGVFSDRVLKSSEKWAKKYIPEITQNSPEYDPFPSYFEVSFSSACNCSCIYCSPTFSTGWTKHIEEFGPYNVSVNTRSLTDFPPPEYMGKAHNPYLDAFWEWWPELYEKLDFFRITGGEPLLSKDTFKILDYIIENPRKGDLTLDINSNLCINDKIFNKFIDKVKRVSETQKMGIYTSGEAKGARANYIRPGMEYNQWMDNCDKYLTEVPNGRLTFMCTYNVLSITSFTEFLKDVIALKRKHPMRVTIDVPFLMNPPYLQALIITKNYLNYIENTVTYMYQNLDIANWKPLCGNAFWDFEISKMRRIYDMVRFKPEDPVDKKFFRARKDFYKFITQHDERYKTNFLETFPEYEDFFNYTKEMDEV